MAQPTPYNRLYDFSDYQEVNPTKPLRGSEVDAEFDALKLTTDQLRANAALIQRDDGALANQVVTPDSLSAGTLAMIHQGEYVPRGAWAGTTVYNLGDLVTYNAATYLCIVAHTAQAAFPDDLSLGRWLLIANGALTGEEVALDLFEGDGTTTAYTLTFNYANSNAAVVFVSGVAQIPVQDFTISGTALTFVVAPPAPSVAGRFNVMVRGTDLEAQLAADFAKTQAINAAASAVAAAASEAASLASATASAASASNSASSATASAASATASDASATASAASASAALASEGAAATSAASASGSASTATTQASNSASSATAAATSATNAANSATAAAGSATAAATSATTALTQATNASNSATSAAGSATTAATQATNAANSAAAVTNAVAQVQDGVKDRFVGGTNYTVGTTTQLTLSATPLKAQTVHVYFSGVYQEKTTYTLAGNVITFGAAIAASSVEVTFDVGRSFAELDAAVAAADVDAIAAAASAAAALVSEGNAETSKDAAEDAQTAAEAAQLAAEAARDQAFSNSSIYQDIATGLAATASGDYFGVTSGGNIYMSLYRNDSGTATFINALYGVPKIDEMEDTQTTTAFVQAAAISQLQARLAPSIVFPN
jgi:hypothetical protein